MTTQYVEIQIRIKAQTDKAVLIEADEGEWFMWVPWSCVEENGEQFDESYEGPMYVAQWYLDEKEIEV